MAQLGMFFDPNAVEPNEGFDLLPPADYRVQITDSDVRATKDGLGRFVWVEMEVLDGEHANRKLWHNFNIVNSSDKAQQIGLGQLSALCHAIGVTGMEDTDDLKFKPFVVAVGTRPAQDGYDAQNRIKSFKPSGQSAGIRSARPTQTAQRPANGQGGASASRPAPARQAGGTGPGQPWKTARNANGRSEEEERANQERTNRMNQPDQRGFDDDIPF
jgi:hypothetical protein